LSGEKKFERGFSGDIYFNVLGKNKARFAKKVTKTTAPTLLYSQALL